MTFEGGVAFEVRHPHYDPAGRLWGEIIAKLDGVPVNQAQINLLDQRQRVDFHQVAMGRDGGVDWQDYLLSVIRPLQEVLDGKASGVAAAPEEQVSLAALISVLAEPFPIDVLPSPLARLIREGATALPCPPDLIGVPMLAALATAIGTSRVLEIKPGWREGPRINAAVVADPGSKKSPALDLAVKPLYRQQERYQEAYQQAKAQYADELAQYEIALAVWKKAVGAGNASQHQRPHAPDEPSMPQIWTSDSTLEALAELLERNPRGLLMVRDELTGWARAMNQPSWAWR